MAMPLLALRQHAARGDVERCEERRRPVPDVAVGHALDVPQAHRKTRLRSIESLDLALLVDAEDHRVIGRIEIEPDDVSNLLDEEGIC